MSEAREVTMETLLDLQTFTLDYLRRECRRATKALEIFQQKYDKEPSIGGEMQVRVAEARVHQLNTIKMIFAYEYHNRITKLAKEDGKEEKEVQRG